MHSNLRSFIDTLRREDQIVKVAAEVDPYLEIAEIHRRVIDEQGKALLFTNVKGSAFPVVTNLFGTIKRIELAFGKRPQEFVKRAVEMVEVLMPPKPKKLWEYRDIGLSALKLGTKKVRIAPVVEVGKIPANLDEIPFLQLWHEDGGFFNTLPLVYTESPVTGKHNLGIYRMQRYDSTSTGMHWQIGKGGGFHYFEAEQQNQSLPVTVFLGGSPAMMLAAVAPLPEDVPELMLASLLAGAKIEMVENPLSTLGLLKKSGKIKTVENPVKYHRLISESEFAICGHVPPHERKPEGPFGDHYGYYSLQHDYPVFHADAVFHRKNAIFPATVVGKPRQEDFYIGDYLQEFLSPLFPLVMPAVRDLWSYGETGFHSLAAAVVRERYGREALSAGFRILGEGQLSLTKFLLLTDKPQDLRDFKSLFAYILARVDWHRDFFIFSQTAFDTLDYSSGKINHGSKAILMGIGDAKRSLPEEFSSEIPAGVARVEVFCPGCIVVEPESGEASAKDLAHRLSSSEAFHDWQVIVIHDEASVALSVEQFLWATWTRFNPATDVFAQELSVRNNHIGYSPPIVIDARMKPHYPSIVEPRADIVRLVDERWSEYFDSK